MIRAWLFFALALAAAPFACGQAATAVDPAAFAAKVQPIYYSLADGGFQSLTCTAMPDWTRLPEKFIAAIPAEVLPKLKASSIRVTMPVRGEVSAEPIYAPTLTAAEVSQYGRILHPFVSGLKGYFEIWPEIVSAGPIPSVAGIKSIEHDATSYLVFQRDPDIELIFNDHYLLTGLILRSPNMVTDERPVFTSIGGRLIVQSNDFKANSNGDILAGHFEQTYQTVDGLTIPEVIQITMGQIEIGFTMHDCSVKKTAPADPK
jgi:hypothetical protein